MPNQASNGEQRTFPGPIRDLVSAIAALNPFQENHVLERLKSFDATEEALLAKYLDTLAQTGVSAQELGHAYATVCDDTLREQVYFKRKKRYRYSSYDEVADFVYQNPEYMRKYMLGLGLTVHLWENHASMFSLFTDTLPATARGAYLEIGPGHGKFLRHAIEHTAYDLFTALDLSQSSLDITASMCREQAASFPVEIQYILQDFLTWNPSRRYAAAVMGEVLEHVEEPDSLLRKLHSCVDEDAYVYLTTCVNAPAIDHIHHFQTVAQVESLLSETGFAIVTPLRLPKYAATVEEAERDWQPINVAYVLKPVQS